MTKRPSPFEPSIYRQSKIHFNSFENDVVTQRQVEEKTLRKLIDGSKKSHSILLDIKDDDQSESRNNLKSDNFLQMCVTNYFTVNGRRINESDRVLITPLETPSRCFFCETRTNSLHQCTRCLEFYCCSCSFINYESSEDKRVCLSCS